MMEIELFDGFKVERKVLKPFIIEDKLFFPVVEIIMNGDEKYFNSLNITPIAFVVEENNDNYVILVNDVEIEEEEILELFLTLK